MSYRQAIEFLYELRVFGMKLGLENTLQLAHAAGDPHHRLRFIHVAGTNGKGSTCAMLESIYRATGLRTGLFTSPHLVAFGERIQVNRRPISEDDVVRLTDYVRGLIEKTGVQATFFEAVTIMALCYFVEQKCDLVIWETGLGGRLDSTNIVTPLAAVITNIQLDHERWLGDTPAAIAREKAGIIKSGVPILTATDESSALVVIKEVAREQNAPLTIVNAPLRDVEISLPGEHQRLNAALAGAVVRRLESQIPVTDAALRAGFKTTQWAGRLQKAARPNGHIVLIDCAHNPAGAQTLAQALRSDFADLRPTLIFGTMADKDYAGICAVLAPLASKFYISSVASQRGADPQILAQAFRTANQAATITICPNLAEALAQTAEEPFVVLTGSIHFVGEAMEALGLQTGAPAERALNDYATATRAVTFDVGGTLIEPWPSVGAVYAEAAGRHGIRVAAADLERQFAAAWRSKKDFGYTLSDWSNLVNSTFAGLTEQPPNPKFFADVYAYFATAAPWRIFPDVIPYLQSLKRQGMKLGIISNWDDRLKPLLRALELDQYFDAIVVSSEVGAHKPDPRIFYEAATRLGVPASAILHIGDSAKEDAEGARAAGFQARLLRRSEGETL